MKNYIQPGDKITVPAPATVVSGAGTVIGGGLFGVATHDAASAATCTFLVEGVVSLPKVSGVAFAVGDRVHWDIDASPPCLIKTSPAAGDVLNVGIVVAAVGTTVLTATIKLTPENSAVASGASGNSTDTSVANLNAWATALATKLNADAGVTDTNYDTDPQA